MKRKKYVSALVFGVTAAVVLSSGCARQQVVKQQELVSPAASTVAEPGKGQGGQELKRPDRAPDPKPATPSESQPTLRDLPAAAELKGVLESIYFDFDSSTLSPQSRETLAKNAEVLKGNGSTIRIEGHCDERGSDEYNLALGDQRAKAASLYLQSMGVPATKLSVISYGEEKPAVSGHDEKAWAQNRRDEFLVLAR